MAEGKVYLVGAGIGYGEYLTLRAMQVLQQAEVVVYDALVNERVLDWVSSDCDRQNVGKRGGLPSSDQNAINQLLIEHCQAGKRVVRLKSGDPLVFGRINPEIQALQQANCPFEVVPGISSALAAPLLAGIPLTDKNLGRCFAVVTAHDPNLLDWSALTRLDTLVVLMGSRTLASIVDALLRHERSPQTPIAILRYAGQVSAQNWFGTLATIVNQTQGQSLSPAIMVIGDVVNLRFMSPALPLTGQTILVTRAAEQSSEFSDRLRQQGASVLELPALEICPPTSWDGLDRAISDLQSFDWLILTSANAVNYFWARLIHQGGDGRSLAGVNIAVVGRKTAQVLGQYGLNADFVPPQYVADSLVTSFPEAIAGLRILFPRVEEGGRELLAKELSAQGATVVEVATYQSTCPEQIDRRAWQALRDRQITVITFASSKTVLYCCQLLENALKVDNLDLSIQELLQSVKVASIGPQTSQTCRDRLGRVDIEAKEYTLTGLTDAVCQFFGSA
jgi:uroporphyrinogen III methyltransferase/synthase